MCQEQWQNAVSVWNHIVHRRPTRFYIWSGAHSFKNLNDRKKPASRTHLHKRCTHLFFRENLAQKLIQHLLKSYPRKIHRQFWSIVFFFVCLLLLFFFFFSRKMRRDQKKIASTFLISQVRQKANRLHLWTGPQHLAELLHAVRGGIPASCDESAREVQDWIHLCGQRRLDMVPAFSPRHPDLWYVIHLTILMKISCWALLPRRSFRKKERKKEGEREREREGHLLVRQSTRKQWSWSFQEWHLNCAISFLNGTLFCAFSGTHQDKKAPLYAPGKDWRCWWCVFTLGKVPGVKKKIRCNYNTQQDCWCPFVLIIEFFTCGVFSQCNSLPALWCTSKTCFCWWLWERTEILGWLRYFLPWRILWDERQFCVRNRRELFWCSLFLRRFAAD